VVQTTEDTALTPPLEKASLVTQPVVKKLIENGNVTFTFPATDIHIVVSADILCATSDVWRAMFTRTMKEGNTLRQSGSVKIPLADHDPDAMELILSVLHYQTESLTSLLSLDLIVRAKILCDQYDLSHISNIWIRDWLRKQQIPELNTLDVGLYMIAAKGCCDDAFETAYRHAVTTFTPDFREEWPKHELLLSPEAVQISGMYIVRRVMLYLKLICSRRPFPTY